MGENSKIEWCTHTFNPWRGCTKVSPGCARCYAEAMSRRNPAVLGIWGDRGTRVVAAEAHWRLPLKWDREAKAAGERHRVFVASLADVFEDRPELVEPRSRLFALIDSTPNLDWLMVTKRPQNVGGMWPTETHLDAKGMKWGASVYGGRRTIRRENVWLMASVEDQARADERIPELFRHRDLVPVLGLSMEPLLGPVDLGSHLRLPRMPERIVRPHSVPVAYMDVIGLDWVIVGGESGPGSRAMSPAWVRSIRDQCQRAEVPFFFKQFGEYMPHAEVPEGVHSRGNVFVRGDGSLVPKTEFLVPQSRDFEAMALVGKKAAGRVLDGRVWDEVPCPRVALP